MENDKDLPEKPLPPEDEPELDPLTGLPKRPKLSPQPPKPAEPADQPETESEAAPAEEAPAPEPAASPKPTEAPAPAPSALPEYSQEEIEQEFKKWNWGAFFLTWIWGIAHNIWIALLALVPFLTFPMMIVLGLKGNEWAWKKKGWMDLAAFRASQKKWARWGLIIFIVLAGLFIAAFAGIFWGVTGALQKTEPYVRSLQLVQADREVQQVLGAPVKPGMGVSGNAQFNGPEAAVNIAYKIKGPRGSGTVFVKAAKAGLGWDYELIGVELGKEKKRIDLTPKTEVAAVPAASLPEVKAPVVEAPKPALAPVPAAAPAPEPAKPVRKVQDPTQFHTIRLRNGNEFEGRVLKDDEAGVTIDVRGMGPIVFGRHELAKNEETGSY